MSVASHAQTVDIPPITRIHGVQVYCAFLQEYQALRRLECRSRRIGSLNGTVVQGLHGILYQICIILAAAASHQQRRIVIWRCHQTQYLACSRFNRYNSTDLVGHQLFAIFLQVPVYAQLQIVPGCRRHIERAILILTLDSAVCVFHEYFHTLVAAQGGLITFFDTEVAGVIAASVITVVLYIVGRHLAYVAKDIGSGNSGILSHRTLLDEESWKQV